MEIYSKDRIASIARWVPVAEGLPDPEEDGDVLVTVNGHYGNVTFENSIELGDYYGNGEWKIRKFENWQNPEVLAWMPLPTEYDGETEKTPAEADAYPKSQLDSITITVRMQSAERK